MNHGRSVLCISERKFRGNKERLEVVSSWVMLHRFSIADQALSVSWCFGKRKSLAPSCLKSLPTRLPSSEPHYHPHGGRCDRRQLGTSVW